MVNIYKFNGSNNHLVGNANGNNRMLNINLINEYYSIINTIIYYIQDKSQIKKVCGIYFK